MRKTRNNGQENLIFHCSTECHKSLRSTLLLKIYRLKPSSSQEDGKASESGNLSVDCLSRIAAVAFGILFADSKTADSQAFRNLVNDEVAEPDM